MKASRNLRGTRTDHYIEKAYEAWHTAVGDCAEALAILGAVHDGIEDFDHLPNPNGKYVREMKSEIEALVLANYKADPRYFDCED